MLKDSPGPTREPPRSLPASGGLGLGSRPDVEAPNSVLPHGASSHDTLVQIGILRPPGWSKNWDSFAGSFSRTSFSGVPEQHTDSVPKVAPHATERLSQENPIRPSALYVGVFYVDCLDLILREWTASQTIQHW